jgi:hypothetical protein
MGVDSTAVQFLVAAKSRGVDFSKVATIGRQYFFPDRKTFDRVCQLLSVQADVDTVRRQSKGYAETFFTSVLGAAEVCSVDASAYEGAMTIHDMNLPISADLKSRFSVVYDGGSLEHVFNVPQALQNCMEMLAVGGYFIQTNGANNYMGHGFYQLSPELIFRVFSKENGFSAELVLLHEDVPGGHWYRVSDPASVGKRVQLTNRYPTSIWTLAKKIAQQPLFSSVPQQSDYLKSWRAHEGEAAAHGTGFQAPRRWHALKETLRRNIPAGMEKLVRTLYTPGFSRQPDCYRPVDQDKLMRGQEV